MKMKLRIVLWLADGGNKPAEFDHTSQVLHPVPRIGERVVLAGLNGLHVSALVICCEWDYAAKIVRIRFESLRPKDQLLVKRLRASADWTEI